MIAREHAEKLRSETAARRPYLPPAAKGILSKVMVSPRCLIGPGDLCEAIGDTVAACDGGDGRSCVAAGQYMQDTPPRHHTAALLFITGCEHGDAEACARVAELRSDDPVDCEHDPLRCAERARRTGKPEDLDAACIAGVASACTDMVKNVSDPELQRTYRETACQLGDPVSCIVLSHQLSSICKEGCYPPDEEESRAANHMACAAGWGICL